MGVKLHKFWRRSIGFSMGIGMHGALGVVLGQI